MSLAGLFLLLLNLPLMAVGSAQVSWWLILLLVFAPTLGSLLQLALSRTREFDADLEAARLTGDPAALASALRKMERYQSAFWEEIFLPGRRIPDPSILRTHPNTEDRVRRLLELKVPSTPALEFPSNLVQHHGSVPEVHRRPRWRRSGVWY